jgi:hypothetical protein
MRRIVLSFTALAFALGIVGCPSGRVSSVVTQATMRNWFGFLQDYEVVIRGVCDEDREVAKR